MHLVKKSLAFYGTRISLPHSQQPTTFLYRTHNSPPPVSIALTTVHHLSLSHSQQSTTCLYRTHNSPPPVSITLTTVHHLSLSSASSIQSMLPHFTSSRSILYRLLTFQVPKHLMSLFRYLHRTKMSAKVRGFLYGCFVTRYASRVRSCYQLAQPSSWRTTTCRLPATAYSIYSQLPSILEAVRPSTT